MKITECLICDKKFKNAGCHFIKNHKMSIKDYYDKYFKKENEGKCLICNKLTRFFNNYYYLTCGKKCASINKNNELYEKYGVVNQFQLEYVKEKTKKTNLEKYGVENVSQNFDIKLKKEETCFKNNGVRFPSHLPSIREKAKKTNLEKYGYENPMFNPKIVQKCITNGGGRCVQKKYITKFGNQILVQGSFELMFVKQCEESNIKIKDGPAIEYLFQDQKRKYFIDFEIEEDNIKKLIEIKSTYYYEKFKEQVLAKKEAAERFAIENDMIYELKIYDKNRKECYDLLQNLLELD